MKRALCVLMALFIALITQIASAEDIGDDWVECWVMCQPDSYLNVREFAKKDANVTGELYMGNKVYTDRKTKRGFIHVVGLNNEAGEGWVAKGYLVYYEPVVNGHVYAIQAQGRTACRRTINGTRRRWLHEGDEVTVFLISHEWCLTNEGFIMTKCIDLKTRLDISEPTDPNDMTWEEDVDG